MEVMFLKSDFGDFGGPKSDRNHSGITDFEANNLRRVCGDCSPRWAGLGRWMSWDGPGGVRSWTTSWETKLHSAVERVERWRKDSLHQRCQFEPFRIDLRK